MSEWFEDEEFWITYAPLMFDESSWAEVPSAVDGILQLSKIPPASRILDLCCGVGRHSVELAKRGFAVTGVDITSAYLSAARETAEAAEVELELIRADARYFSRPAAFELCVNLFTSFGYFATRDEDLLLLSRCAKNLSAGGSLIVETLGREIAIRDFSRGEEFDRAGWRVKTEYEAIGEWQSLRNRWILENDAQRIDRSFDLRLYSPQDMREILSEAGFRSIEIFGGLDGRAYDERAMTMVALARI
jgi:SAM-dependent methyltransferase